MNKRILVTYATRAGSTAEVASTIGETLAARGFAVEVKPIKEKPPVEGYDGVLIGSAIRVGQWLPEAVDFVKRNQNALNRVPVALFTVHLNNLGDDKESRNNRLAYLDSVRRLLHPTEEAFFAGKLEYARLTWFERLMAQMMKAPEEDRRNWQQIAGWAEHVLA